jgi:type IV secretory pathway TrbD component
LFCYGDLPALHVESPDFGHGIAVIALRCLVKSVAGFLLGMQLAATFMGGRIALLVFGYKNIGPVHIFDQPWMATSVSDLWSNRWHQVLRYYFTGLGYSLADALSALLVQLLSSCKQLRTRSARHMKQGVNSSKGGGSSSSGSSSSSSTRSSIGGKGGAAGSNEHKLGSRAQLDWQREVKRATRTLVVFAMSGVVHEYIVWAAFGVVSGKHLAFFMLHGVAALAEGLAANLAQSTGFGASVHVPMWLRRVWVLGFCLVTSPLFVDVLLEHRHYQNYVPPVIVPVTALAMESLGLCKCR